jgi:hypothetical protein
MSGFDAARIYSIQNANYEIGVLYREIESIKELAVIGPQDLSNAFTSVISAKQDLIVAKSLQKQKLVKLAQRELELLQGELTAAINGA